ncbi:MAG: hypothetical protein A3F24_00780 [Candidatus Colwellbacteria bacterium RIFCSPHIGHO2_12_FULL_44_17]|uniref:Glycosyltransferase 2-like domain-containing protein n=2 Tax=Candidatus Colwelliibacteriota TaxID=1817904 RepID=A0A1G1Z7T1_9BACT|nr:MAG: hypothetical protein A3F24_00780 [Candidatus Colwellbacteria bacterium RIFCSPHIGHO2_12_FULL_44_17]OGY60116.1 MAG: hypothetical protein A3I31_00160 [Candidatus Colwellbacteria bacterium RIFCSPLOWO2_02_FULL_44_20b]
MPKPHLSIILPFRDSERELFALTLLKLDEALSTSDYSYEVLILEENARVELHPYSQEFTGLFKKTKWFENDTVRGVGDLFRQGMLKARGTFRLFLEPFAISSFEGISKALALCGKGSEIVIGRRTLRTLRFEASRSAFFRARTVLTTLFTELSRIIFHYDTRSGFVLLSGETADKLALLMRVQNSGFIQELLILGKRFDFTAVSHPIVWQPSPNHLTLREKFVSFLQSFKVRLWIKKGKYDT